MKAMIETNRVLEKTTPAHLATAVRSAMASNGAYPTGTQAELEQRWLANVEDREAQAQQKEEQEHRSKMRDAKGGMSMALDMPCAESMAVDEAQPALCHAHCEAEKLSLDKHELPAPIAISAMPASFRLAAVVPQFSSVALQAPHLMHATAPPVAIRNCCFRI